MVETKLNQVPNKPFLFSKPTINPLTQRFSHQILENNANLSKKHFQALSEKWKVSVQEQWKEQHSTKKFLAHVVKEGETLTSISRMYGVSLQSIAAINEKIVDISLVFQGQHLNIPSYGMNKENPWNTWFYCFKARDRGGHSPSLLGRHGDRKIFTMLSTHHLLPVKSHGYLLVMIPLIAFCIRCLISVLHHRVSEGLKNQLVNETNAHHHASKGIRWKTALSDIREVDILDTQSGEASGNSPEDQLPVSFEEMSYAYTKIEPAYQKFLSDCGMSDSGYWRGGSHE